MKNDDEDSKKSPDNGVESSQLSTSYIYPVKSLLTGIQPAPPTQTRPSVPHRNPSQSVGLAALQDLLAHQLTNIRKKSADGSDGVSPHPMPSRSHTMLYPYPPGTAITNPLDVSEDHPHSVSDPDRQSSPPISLAEAALLPAPTHPPISASYVSLSPLGRELSAPNGPPSDTAPAPPQSPENKSFIPPDSKPLQGLTERLLNDPGRSSPTHSVDSHVSHISQSGIVHLPPSSSTSTSSRAASRGSGSHTHSSSRKYFPSSNSNVSSKKMDRVPEAQEERKPDDHSGRSGTDLKPLEFNMQGESQPAGNFTTTRYRHETDENGNHRVIGREGEIRRCEDEVRIS